MLLLLLAQSFLAQPPALRQGETFRLSAPPQATHARLDSRTVPLFDGKGLMPTAIDAKPGARSIEFLDAQANVLGSVSVTLRDARYPIQNIQISQEKKELTPAPGEREALQALAKTVSPAKLWSEPLVRPVPGCMISPFGVQRYHNGKPSGNFHRGLDLRAATGVPIRAVASGTLQIVQMFNLTGGTVGIDHGQGVTSVYFHMSRFAPTAKEGTPVKAGQIIGFAGATGFATGPHLHWQFQVHGLPVQPSQWTGPTPSCYAPAPAKKSRPRRAALSPPAS